MRTILIEKESQSRGWDSGPEPRWYVVSAGDLCLGACQDCNTFELLSIAPLQQSYEANGPAKFTQRIAPRWHSSFACFFSSVGIARDARYGTMSTITPDTIRSCRGGASERTWNLPKQFKSGRRQDQLCPGETRLSGFEGGNRPAH